MDVSQVNQFESSRNNTLIGSSANFLINSVQHLIINNALSPLLSVAREGICATFAKIQVGSLKLVFPNGERKVYGNANTGFDVTLTVLKDQFWMRLALYSSLGFAEAYMNSECDISNLTEFLQLLNQNMNYIKGNKKNSKSLVKRVMMGLNYFINTEFANSITNSINNISAHYDLGNDMFQLFLDPSMTYSCPIWDANDSDDDLHKAQLRKLHTIVKKAKIVESDHVLEIGSGWGSFAIEAVKLTGCRVTTLTLSIEQKALADQRIHEAGLSDRISVKLCDYRTLNTDFKFDKIVSIEMLEAVGKEYYDIYFETCHNLLKEEGGLMVIQFITVHEDRYERFSSRVDFCQKYIFPGGHLPTITMIMNAIYKGSNGNLITDDLQNIGTHYAKALRLWNEAFNENYSIMSKSDPKKYNEMFYRCYQYYFKYCQAGFREHLLGDVQMVLTRPRNKIVGEGIPL